MQKIKSAFIIFVIASTISGVQAQNLRLGSSVASLGFNYCSYTFSSTNLCGSATTNGNFPGFTISPSYSYAVLNKLTLDATVGFSIYGGGIGLDFGIGFTYNIFFPAHSSNPFDAFIRLNAGYSYLSMQNSSISDAGKFVSGGIFYILGLGIRKYFFGNVGLFADVNYAIYPYSGGQVVGSSTYKLPFTLSISGFNFGGGICLKLSPPHQGNATTY